MKKQILNSGRKHGVIKTSIGLILLLPAFLFTNSCSKEHNPEYTPSDTGGFEVVSHTDLSLQDINDQLMLLPDYADIFDYHDFYYQSMQIPGAVGPFMISHDVVKYSSIDNKGAKKVLTGLLIYPHYFPPVGKIKAPIISFNHATQLMKKFAPSKWKTAHWKDTDDFPEEVLADIMASVYGWIIIMPDYQGMADDAVEVQPFCVRNQLSQATADIVQATIYATSGDRHRYVNWNGKTFLYGYSEGGFVTMASARELESRKVSLNGVVCMDGPYDLSGTMLKVMLGDSAFPEPYFLPMVVVGYNSVYPEAFAYNLVLREPYRTDLPQYTNGYYDEDVVNSKMPRDKILKKIFTDAFVDSLKNVNSLAHRIFAMNNSHIDWVPKSKMLLWHCVNDDCVAFGNYIAAMTRFNDIGLTNVDYVAWPALAPKPSEGTIHARIAPRAFFEGSLWIFHHSK